MNGSGAGDGRVTKSTGDRPGPASGFGFGNHGGRTRRRGTRPSRRELVESRRELVESRRELVETSRGEQKVPGERKVIGDPCEPVLFG